MKTTFGFDGRVGNVRWFFAYAVAAALTGGAAYAAAPMTGTVTPAAGTYATNQYFTITTTYTDADGYADLAVCLFLIKPIIDGNSAIYVYYNEDANVLYMYGDAGPWMGGYTPGTGSVLENSQGRLDPVNTTVSKSGNTVTVNWRISFKNAYVGTHNTYLYCNDAGGGTAGWDDKGDAIVAGNTATMTPNSGTYFTNTHYYTFTTNHIDNDGFANIANCYMLIKPSIDGLNAILPLYDVQNDKLYLYNDTGTAWLGGITPGTGSVIENSQGRLDPAATTVSKSGNTVTVNWRISFKNSYIGAHNTYAYTYDVTGLASGWLDLGDATVVLGGCSTTVNNPGFESGTANWSFCSTHPNFASQPGGDNFCYGARTGSGAAGGQLTNSDTAAQAAWYQTINVTAGHTYYIQFYGQVGHPNVCCGSESTLANDPLQLRAHNGDATGLSCAGIKSGAYATTLLGEILQSSTDCGSYVPVAGSFTPTSTTQMTIIAFADFNQTGSGGCCYTTTFQIDDFIVMDQTPLAPPTSANVDRNNFCPNDAGNISLTATGGAGTTLKWYTDGCGTTAVGTGSPLVIASPTATTTYYARWEDCSGASTCASVTVTVVDNTPPTISQCAPPQQANADANCQAMVPDFTANVVANDDCSGVTITQSPPAGTLVGLGLHNVTITVTDASNNVSQCPTSFTVVDAAAPSITCPADQVLAADGNGQAVLPDYRSQAVAGDNCDAGLTLTQSPLPGTLLNLGPTTVTITATDDDNNDADCQFTVTVDYAPTATTWKSVRTHGGAGEFWIALTPTGATSEPRMGGIRKIIVEFDQPVVPVTGPLDPSDVSVVDDLAAPHVPTSVVLTGGDTMLEIAFAGGLPDLRGYTIELAGKFKDTATGLVLGGDTNCYVAGLVGDANNDGDTDLVDVAMVKGKNRAPLTQGDPNSVRCDVNVDGGLNLIDMALTKSKNGNSAP